jgi:hypothetical protein
MIYPIDTFKLEIKLANGPDLCIESSNFEYLKYIADLVHEKKDEIEKQFNPWEYTVQIKTVDEDVARQVAKDVRQRLQDEENLPPSKDMSTWELPIEVEPCSVCGGLPKMMILEPDGSAEREKNSQTVKIACQNHQCDFFGKGVSQGLVWVKKDAGKGLCEAWNEEHCKPS